MAMDLSSESWGRINVYLIFCLKTVCKSSGCLGYTVISLLDAVVLRCMDNITNWLSARPQWLAQYQALNLQQTVIKKIKIKAGNTGMDNRSHHNIASLRMPHLVFDL